MGAASAAAASEGQQTTLNCEVITEGILSGLVSCTYVSDSELQANEGVQFTASVGGTTQTVTAYESATDGASPLIRTNSGCGSSQGVCYRFLFLPEQSGGSVEVSNVLAVGSSQPADDGVSQAAIQGSTAVADGDGTGSYPCEGNPGYTCTAEAPTGDNVVYIHNDGATVTIDSGNNGIDETDQQHNYDASTPASTRDEAEAKKEVRDAVQDIPEDQMAVITAANGYQSSAQQENAFSLEQQLWDRGEPYMVCFDPITYTNNGVEVTVQPDCVIITPQ